MIDENFQRLVDMWYHNRYLNDVLAEERQRDEALELGLDAETVEREMKEIFEREMGEGNWEKLMNGTLEPELVDILQQELGNKAMALERHFLVNDETLNSEQGDAIGKLESGNEIFEPERSETTTEVEQLFESYARTLIADSQDSGRRPHFGYERYKGDVVADLLSLQKWLRNWAEDEGEDDESEDEEVLVNDTEGSNGVVKDFKTDGAASSDSETSEDDSTEYYTSCQTIWRNRSFFITSTMKIGLGPKTCQVGDDIAILFGGSWPFILRRLPEKQHLDEELFKFIGPSYVDRVMFGEAMKARDTSKDREFVIH